MNPIGILKVLAVCIAMAIIVALFDELIGFKYEGGARYIAHQVVTGLAGAVLVAVCASVAGR